MGLVEIAATSAARPLAASAANRLLNRLSGGNAGRLIKLLDERFGQGSGLSATGLAPILDDPQVLDVIETYAESGVFDEDQAAEALEGHLWPLQPGQTTCDAAREVAAAMRELAPFALDSDRAAVIHEIRALRAELYADAVPSLVEEEVAESSTRASTWADAVVQPYYLNVSRLQLDPAVVEAERQSATLPESFEDATGEDRQHAMVLLEHVMREWGVRAVDVAGFEMLDDVPLGARISFAAHFRTRNFRNATTGRRLTGNLSEEPYIYARRARRDVVIPIDPRWLTTFSARVEFSSGRVFAGGLGVLRSRTRMRATVSAIVLGLPLTDANRFFYRE